jgi:biotin carboxyl carrier protein
MQPSYKLDENTHLVTPLREDDDLLIRVDGTVHRVRIIWRNRNECELTMNGRTRIAYVAQDEKRLFVHLDGKNWTLIGVDEFGNTGSELGSTDRAVLAPMPGVVVEVYVKPGQRVSVGDALLLIESMKLQSEIRANVDGVVAHISVAPGASFERHAVLVEIADEGTGQ